MTAALFGAGGRAGRRLAARLAERGIAVRALVRNRARTAAAPGLVVVEGDARSTDDVARTVAGTDAVFCALGMTDITTPSTDFSDAVRTIVRALEAAGPRRLIVIGTAGVLPHPTGGYRNKDGVSDAGRHIAAEHIRNHETLRDSALDWTLVCPVELVEDLPPGRRREAIEDLPAGSFETGYDDLANLMVELLDRPGTIGHRIGVVSDR